MQNKGFVQVLAVLLLLVCFFYLSFSVVTNHYNKLAIAYAERPGTNQVDSALYNRYIDSISPRKVWFGYTYKECLDKELNLGLDLKGGMNVVLEVSQADILRSLAVPNPPENFNKALAMAQKAEASSQKDFLTLFEESYLQLDPNAKLSTLFSTYDKRDQIPLSATNEQVMAVLRKDVSSAIDNSFNVLRSRIDRFGVVQPDIQKLENTGRILIELPGVKDPERVRRLLQGTANLEFWETYNIQEIYPALASANNTLVDILSSASKNTADTTQTAKASTAKTEVAKPAVHQSKEDSLAALIKENSTKASPDQQNMAAFKKKNPLFGILLDVNPQGSGPRVGIALAADTSTIDNYLNMPQIKALFPADLSLKWGVKSIDPKGQYFELIACKSTTKEGPALQGNVVTDANADYSQYGSNSVVDMKMNSSGANTWAILTKQNIGKCVAIVLDNYVYSYPVVNQEITGGNSQISGRFTVEEAKDLANVLKSGRMPAPARIVQSDTVGPSLGAQSIHDGLISFVIAFLLVLLFMVFYYGWIPGLIADGALLINVIFIMGILASFRAVLTLPGIAGIVLTLGMAVDANVLIYERIREEKEAGKNQRKAISEGFKNAFSAIFDSNATSLLTGIILFIFGTGPIKGFATTFIIGILTSFFTAVFLSHLVYDIMSQRENMKDLPFSTRLTKHWLLHPNINFIGVRKKWYIVSGVILLTGVVSLATRGLSMGIDFSGGRNYQVKFDHQVNTDQVRNLLKGAFDGNVSVISIGTDNRQVRISTNYKIADNSTTIDDQIETMIYNGVKPLLSPSVSRDQFVRHEIISSQKVGPAVAEDIKISAIWAVFLAVVGIALYILLRFPSFTFSVGALASLMHDVLLVVGLYSLLYSIMPFSLEIDQSFIAAILTILGYSINDTVVIFDRIREYRTLYPKRELSSLMNEAMNHTLRRTINTSLSVALVLLAIFIFGGDVIRGFVFALLIGVVTGTYSSILVASSIAYEMQLWQAKRKKLKAAK
ncbi:protein translocase subunit SecDF [Microbacter margulisiae]|uniref:Multifunctional fusion protein n=1 Tax=Microbacter margulisiae TaxID=1350067 RepID=A0A7W5DSG5_9PORP|nr:protein translocase subunit SecDF [Microbacter margulisiae]MBB3187408.1 SecD/SecF fusion protein [Microbacter margulisiae]